MPFTPDCLRSTHWIPDRPCAEFMTVRSPNVMVWLCLPTNMVTYFWWAWDRLIISVMKDDSDLLSKRSDMAPSQRKFRLGDSYVALMKVVFSSFRESRSPIIANPKSSTSKSLVRRPESRVINVSSFDFSNKPFTTSEDPSISAYS